MKAERLWNISGSFPKLMGEVQEDRTGTYSFENGEIRIRTTREEGPGGVTRQHTELTNTSGRTVRAGALLSVFTFTGAESEVYTQMNTSLHESQGRWQPLHTTVAAVCPHIRTSFGAAPVLALWNRQTSRGTVWHLLAGGSWEMRASRCVVRNEKTEIRVEIGPDSRHLNRQIAPGETIVLPDILYYPFKEKRDLDCHKLHEYMNAVRPRREMPVIYNSWLYRFHRMTPEGILAQIPVAKELGVDYFVLDAGWYGKKDHWTRTRGDWVEEKEGTLEGRVAEISEAVRKAGMKFGFWLEAETASPSAETIRLHPEYYLVQDGRYFFNYARADAREHMTKIACGLIDLYHASFIKFDFNQDIEYDPSGSDFADFHAGFRSFVNGLKARYPELYVEGCASGGLRMDLGDSMLFDSFWLSDNQSPYFGNRIVRETMLRLPPQVIERWIVARSDECPQEDYKGDHTQLFSANDSLWVDVRSVQTSYLESFLTGGVAGFSCDLTAFSEKDLAFLKEYLTRYKADKAFWDRAVGRILCDTETMTVLEYSDPAFEEVRLVAYGERIRQETTEIIPVLDPNARYRVGEEIRTGSELMDEGIEVNGPESLRALFLTLRKER